MEKERGTYLACKKDGFPMLKINERWECAGEYLYRCIGDEEIIDLVQEGSTTYYIFKNGHKLPILCPCCGMPMVIKDIERERRDMYGRRLKSISINRGETKDRGKIIEIQLKFLKPGWFSRNFYLGIPPQAATQLRHPIDCPHKGYSTKKKKRRNRSAS